MDLLVHVRLAEALMPHDPRVAMGLLATSPHFATDTPPVVAPSLPRWAALPLAAVVGRGAIALERFRVH